MNIYVGNLSYEVSDSDLKNTFAEFGGVKSAKVVMDQATGRSKGFGFIEMDDADAQEAIAKLNGFDLKGRSITVNEARPRPERSNRY